MKTMAFIIYTLFVRFLCQALKKIDKKQTNTRLKIYPYAVASTHQKTVISDLNNLLQSW